jgi:hypothetical protein
MRKVLSKQRQRNIRKARPAAERRKLGLVDDAAIDAPPCEMRMDHDGLFVIFNGMKIARRADPDTPQARTWVSLEPGYAVFDNTDMTAIIVEYYGKRVH